MESDAEALARRHTLRELETMESESILAGADITGAAITGLLSCAIGAVAAWAKVPVLAIPALLVGAYVVMLALRADAGPPTAIIRDAIMFKKTRLTAKR